MDETNQDIELMRRLIEKKKQKSASQGSVKRGPEDWFSTRASKKKQKKAGLPFKQG